MGKAPLWVLKIQHTDCPRLCCVDVETHDPDRHYGRYIATVKHQTVIPLVNTVDPVVWTQMAPQVMRAVTRWATQNEVN